VRRALGHAVPTFALMQRATPQSIRCRARKLDEGEAAVLAASLAAAIASVDVVVRDLASVEGEPGPGQTGFALVT
jgi:uncharacterized membrane protein